MAGWPTITQVRDAVVAAGLPMPSATAANLALQSAIEAWESETRWQPFAAADSALASPVHIPLVGAYSVLSLGGGILPGSVTAITLGGEALTFSGTSPDVAFTPPNALVRGRPYTCLKLLRRQVHGSCGELVVTGRWGYCAADAIPADAAQAVLARVCLDLGAPGVQGQALVTSEEECDAPLEQVDEGQQARKFATSVTERTAALTRWEDLWKGAVKSYRRVSVA